MRVWKMILTQARLKHLLDYDPATGIFVRRVSLRGHSRAGDVVGKKLPTGYLLVMIDGRQQYLHRLAFLYMTGSFPANHVDHINGVRGDNRWCNLRNVTRSENQHNFGRPNRNGSTGYLGVSFHKSRGMFRATITINGVSRHIGHYPTAALAHEAYITAKDKFHPTHKRLKRSAA